MGDMEQWNKLNAKSVVPLLEYKHRDVYDTLVARHWWRGTGDLRHAAYQAYADSVLWRYEICLVYSMSQF